MTYHYQTNSPHSDHYHHHQNILHHVKNLVLPDSKHHLYSMTMSIQPQQDCQLTRDAALVPCVATIDLTLSVLELMMTIVNSVDLFAHYYYYHCHHHGTDVTDCVCLNNHLDSMQSHSSAWSQIVLLAPIAQEWMSQAIYIHASIDYATWNIDLNYYFEENYCFVCYLADA